MVRVYRIDLPSGVAGPNVDAFDFGRLAPAESARAARFRNQEDCRRYVVGRVALRQLLGHELGIQPRDAALSENAFGKPYLEGPAGRALRFNVAHSGQRVLVALGQDGDVGVDVELKRPIPDMDALASRFFAPGEVEAMRKLGDVSRVEAFYACWTRKEALLKARGTGLSEPLDAFEVSVDADPTVRLRWRVAPTDRADWCICGLDLGSEYAAALACEGTRVEVELHGFAWSRHS